MRVSSLLHGEKKARSRGHRQTADLAQPWVQLGVLGRPFFLYPGLGFGDDVNDNSLNSLHKPQPLGIPFQYAVCRWPDSTIGIKHIKLYIVVKEPTISSQQGSSLEPSKRKRKFPSQLHASTTSSVKQTSPSLRSCPCPPPPSGCRIRGKTHHSGSRSSAPPPSRSQGRDARAGSGKRSATAREKQREKNAPRKRERDDPRPQGERVERSSASKLGATPARQANAMGPKRVGLPAAWSKAARRAQSTVAAQPAPPRLHARTDESRHPFPCDLSLGSEREGNMSLGVSVQGRLTDGLTTHGLAVSQAVRSRDGRRWCASRDEAGGDRRLCRDCRCCRRRQNRPSSAG